MKIALSVGYNRERSELGGEFEGHLVSIVLLLGGVALVFVVVDLIFRVLNIHLLGN